MSKTTIKSHVQRISPRDKLHTYQLSKGISSRRTKELRDTTHQSSTTQSHRGTQDEAQSGPNNPNLSVSIQNQCTQRKNAQDLFTALSAIKQVLLQVRHNREQLCKEEHESGVSPTHNAQQKGERWRKVLTTTNSIRGDVPVGTGNLRRGRSGDTKSNSESDERGELSESHFVQSLSG